MSVAQDGTWAAAANDLLPARRLGGWSAPHVMIWTLRRCGASGLEPVFWGAYPHDNIFTDPLSPGKRLGHVGARLEQEPERLDFHRGVAALFAAPVVIRQQLETISKDGATLLLATAMLQRAAHVVLYRRNELKRLESMLIAQSTGYWGDGPPGKYAARIQAGEVQPEAVDLDALFRASDFGVQQLCRVRAMLHATDLPFIELCLEDLFARDNAEAVRQLRDGLAWKGLEYQTEDIAKRLRTSADGHRSSRLLAKHALGLDRFRTMSEARPELTDITALVAGNASAERATANPAEQSRPHPGGARRPTPLAALRTSLPLGAQSQA